MKTFNEYNPFSQSRHRISTGTKINILEDLKNYHFTYSDVAKKYGISNTSVISIFDSYVNLKRNSLTEFMCFDEVHVPMHEYDSKYVFMIMDFMTNNLLEMLPTRRKQDLIRYFENIPDYERNTVKYVSIDMWDTYKYVINRFLPNALVIVDSFHIVKSLYQCFNNIRVRIMNKYSRDSNEYYLLKNFNWLLTKSNVDLDNEAKYNRRLKNYFNYRQIFNMLTDIDNDLKKAHVLLEVYINFNCSATIEDCEEWFEAIYIAFIESRIHEYDSFIVSLRNWKREILNSFIRINGKRISSGPMESLNGRFDKLELVSNGFQNYKRTRNRALYCFNRNSNYSLKENYSTNKTKGKKRGKYSK